MALGSLSPCLATTLQPACLLSSSRLPDFLSLINFSPLASATVSPPMLASAPYSSSRIGGMLGLGHGERRSHLWREAASRVGTNFSSDPIDVVAEIRQEKIVILGGSGFVGSAIAEEAVNLGIEVVSLSRSGRPTYADNWLDKVVWVSGDVFSTDWDSLLKGATAVISTLGGFGTNEQMERLNGDANIVAVNAAHKLGIKKFVFVSVHDYNLPEVALNTGYFKGKRRAEQEIFSKYPNSGTILRPGFIYGSRRVNGFDIPLDFIGKPLEKFLTQNERFTKTFSKLPASDLLLAPPVNVADVALAALAAIKDDTVFGTLDIEQIKEAATAFNSSTK